MALTFLTNSSYSVLLTTYLVFLFFTTSRSLLKSTELVSNLQMSNLYTLFFKLLKSFGIFSNLSIHISTSDFKLAKSAFLAKYVSTPFAFLSQILLHS